MEELIELIESRLSQFGNVQIMPTEVSIKRLYQMKDSPIVKGKGEPRKNIEETIKNVKI